MSHPSLFFLHIPKTAGTSLITAFSKSLGSDQVLRAGNPGHLSKASVASLARWRFVAGHFRWCDSRDLIAERFSFTFLRDPVERALSHYAFHRHHAEEAANPDILQCRTHTLEDLLSADGDGDQFSFLTNHQTWFLSGIEDVACPPREVLAAAKANLDSLSFVGVVEDWALSVDLLSALAHVPQISAAIHENRSNRTTQVSPQLRRLVEEHNRLDLELYAYARQRLERARGRFFSQYLAGQEVHAESQPLPVLAAQESSEFGSKEAEITGIEVVSTGGADGVCEAGADIRISITVEAHRDIHDLTVGFQIADEMDRSLYATNTRLLGLPLWLRAGQRKRVTFSMACRLVPGAYTLRDVSAHAGVSHRDHCYHWIRRAKSFIVEPRGPARCVGVVDLQADANAVICAEMPRLAIADVPAIGLTALDAPAKAEAGSQVVIHFKVQNRSPSVLSSEGCHPIETGLRLRGSESDKPLLELGWRGSLVEPVPPGAESCVALRFRLPSEPGKHWFRASLLQRNWFWFDDVGGQALEFPVEVLQPSVPASR
jgi:hypothetical protein